MAGEWPTATVAELQRDGVLLVEDGNHGEYRPRPDEFVDMGVAFIRAADMDAGRVLFETAARINEPARKRITKGIGAPGDVLLSHKGTVGKVALVDDDAPPFVCSPQTTFWRTLDHARLDRKYLYAFLRSAGFHAQLATRAGETDMAPYVSLTSQRGLTVTLPPINIQRAIAHILGTLDDKIELNRRMSETLEAMALALFKSWFVDFDPVRAKMDGRWRRGAPLHSPLPAGEGSGVRAAPPDRAAVTASLPADLRDFARELRRRTTDAETLLWRLLRNRLMAGAKFRRQHPLPPYVLDFYCHDAGLAVELDGGQHNEAAGRRHDARRDAFLAQKGIRVLRFWNHEVLNQTEAVLEAIYAAIEQAPSRVEPSPPAPLPEGEGSFHLPAHLYDIFPDRLVDSELGEIPEGWEVRSIYDIADVIYGAPFASSQFNTNGVGKPLIRIRDLANEAPGIWTPEQHPKGYMVKPGNIVVGMDGEFRAHLWGGAEAWLNQRLCVFAPKKGYSAAFVRNLIIEPLAHVEATETATTVIHIGKSDIDRFVAVVPSPEVLAVFNRFCQPWYDRIVKAKQESRTLATLRDALLPKLISGELRIKDSEVLARGAI